MSTSAPDLQQLPAVVQARSDWHDSSSSVKATRVLVGSKFDQTHLGNSASPAGQLQLRLLHNSVGRQVSQGGCGISILVGLPNSAGQSE